VTLTYKCDHFFFRSLDQHIHSGFVF